MKLGYSYNFFLRYIILAITITTLVREARAQILNPEFETYNTVDGLSQNWVLSMIQDQYGFMWIGTDNGLSRFDGHEFKVLKHIDQDSNSLLDNSIQALYLDEFGCIWIGTNKGICKYYPENERLERVPIDYTNNDMVNGYQVSSIQKDPEGNMWITYIGDGIDVIFKNQKEVRHYIHNRDDKYQIKDDVVADLLFMPDGNILIGTLAGIEVLDREAAVINDKEAKEIYPWKDLIHNSIKCFMLSKDSSTLWIGTELNGFYIIDLITNNLKHFNKENSDLRFNHILSFQEDFKGNTWIGSEALYIYNPESKTLSAYDDYIVKGQKVSKNPIYSFFQDKDNNMWLGTFRLGVMKYNPNDSKIQHFHANKKEAGIESNEILSFMEDDVGQFWVGTGGAGLVKLRADYKGFEKTSLNAKLGSPVVRCMYKDSLGYFWIGTWDNGLIRYHPQTEDIKHFHPKEKNFESIHVWDIIGDNDGGLLLATLRDGLCYFSTKTFKYEYIKNDPKDSSSLINDDVLTLYRDRKGNLWIGTGDGLGVLPKGAKKFKNFRYDQNKQSISSNIILCFYEDVKGNVWFGTNGGGITIMNKDFTIEKILTEKDGLPSNTVTAIQSDNNNDVWISTYKGLAKIEYKDLSVVDVPQISGLDGKEYIYRSNYKTKDGKLVFGSVTGFDMFYPDSLNFNPLHEQVLFTSLVIFNDEISASKLYNGRTILSKSIVETKEINLSYQDYSFTITFAPVTYNWQKSLKYSYFLENLDKEWHFTTSDRRFVHYTNLSPGEYTLKVRASFDGKNWPKNAQTLKIYISPPWWGTVWFKLVIVLSLLLILASVYRLRIGFLRMQSQKLETLVLQRTTELKQSNEEIQNLLEEVAIQKRNIEYKNKQLQKINGELGEQRDNLAVKSIELENAQYTLKEINTSLEQLVSKRTEKLNDTVKELETFLYRASHDLRGPIMSMLGLISLGKIESKDSGEDKVYYDYLHKSVMKLERTLQKLLEKHTILKISVSPEIFTKSRLMDILKEIKEEIRFFRKEDLEIIIPDGIEFKTDRTLLSILLSNLLENAFLFSEHAENRKVLLEFKSNRNRTVISVTDHGIGVKREIKEKIFTMFYRGSELSTGNGLGLYLVKSAIDRLDGEITVETQEGTYSCFTVTI